VLSFIKNNYILLNSNNRNKLFRALWIAALTSTLLVVIFVFLGLLMYAYYADCDPIAAKRKNDQSNEVIENGDQVTI